MSVTTLAISSSRRSPSATMSPIGFTTMGALSDRVAAAHGRHARPVCLLHRVLAVPLRAGGTRAGPDPSDRVAGCGGTHARRRVALVRSRRAPEAHAEVVDGPCRPRWAHAHVSRDVAAPVLLAPAHRRGLPRRGRTPSRPTGRPRRCHGSCGVQQLEPGIPHAPTRLVAPRRWCPRGARRPCTPSVEPHRSDDQPGCLSHRSARSSTSPVGPPGDDGLDGTTIMTPRATHTLNSVLHHDDHQMHTIVWVSGSKRSRARTRSRRAAWCSRGTGRGSPVSDSRPSTARRRRHTPHHVDRRPRPGTDRLGREGPDNRHDPRVAFSWWGLPTMVFHTSAAMPAATSTRRTMRSRLGQREHEVALREEAEDHHRQHVGPLRQHLVHEVPPGSGRAGR